MELCVGAFVLAFLAAAAIGAWVIVAAVVRALAGGGSDRPRPAARPPRYKTCPGCDAPLRSDDRDCPDCGLNLAGTPAAQLHRVRTARREIEDLRADAQLDDETALRVLDRLDARRLALLGPAEPRPIAPTADPLPQVRPIARPVAAPVAPPEPPVVTSPPAPAAPPPPPRRTTGEMLAEFMHERNILWGELAGGVLIVGCSIALVLSLWRSLEALPYFPFLLSSAITAAMFGAGQYTLHHWRLTATSRGLLVIALLLAPLNLLLLTDPGTHGVVGWLDVAVKAAAVLAFAVGVRTAGRDVLAAVPPGPPVVPWLLSLGIVGAAATRLLPAAGGAALAAWLPAACGLVACGVVLWVAARRHARDDGEPLGESAAGAVLLFVGLASFAVLAAWGAGLARAEPLGDALRQLALLLVAAAVPVVAAGLLVHRRLAEPVGLRVTGTAVALAGAAAMLSAVVPAWPDPVAVLAASAAAGVVLSAFALRDRLAWVHLAAILNLALAAVVGVTLVRDGGVAPPDADATAWLLGRMTSAESALTLAAFAALLALLALAWARAGRTDDTAAYSVGGVATVVAALFLATVRGVESPFHAAAAHALGTAVLLTANIHWRRRVLTDAAVWLVLPATLWLLWATRPDQREWWGVVVAAEGLVLAAAAWAMRGGWHLRATCGNVAAAAAVLGVALAATAEAGPDAPVHTATLLTAAATALVLADLFAAGWLAGVGSASLLAALLHLAVYPADVTPLRLALLAALAGHAATATSLALTFRRGDRGRILANPLGGSALLTSALAVPLIVLPDPPHALAWAGLTAAVGLVWLTLTVAWRERGGFPAFQVALTTAAVYVALAWVHDQPWAGTSTFRYADPRALQAYGLAVALAGLGWVLARRLTDRVAHDLWTESRPSADRALVGAVVLGQLSLAVFGVLPEVLAELTPAGATLSFASPAERVHAWGGGAWLLLVALAVVQAAELRVPPRRDRRGDGPLVALMLLALTVPFLLAGAFAPDVAAASALRWGLATVFVLGVVVMVVRDELRYGVRTVGVWARGRTALVVARVVLTAVASGVVVLTLAVAELGFAGLTPSGPTAGTLFARLGWTASNVVPLALMVFGLAGLALRERSRWPALAGAVLFAATLAGGYALTVVTAGLPFDGSRIVHATLLASGGLAAWGLGWLAVEWRVPGGGALTAVVTAALAGVVMLAGLAASALFIAPQVVLPTAAGDLGLYGWTPLIFAAVACFWHTDRAAPHLRAAVLGWAGVVAGVLVACVARRWDAPGAWVSFHALAGAWAVAGLMLTVFVVGPGAVLGRGWGRTSWPSLIAAALGVLALRGGWDDPLRPLAPAGAALAGGLLAGTMAARFGGPVRAALSVLLFDLAAVLVWMSWGPPTTAAFALSVATGLGLSAVVWAAVAAVARLRPAVFADVDSSEVPRGAAWLGLALAAIGLLPTLAGAGDEPPALAWGAIVTVGLGLFGAGYGRRTEAAAGLYPLGVAAVLLAVAHAHPGPVWEAWPTPLALAGYVLAASVFATVLRPDRERPAAFVVAQCVVGAAALVLAVATSLREPTLPTRLAGPLAAALLAPAAAFLVRGEVTAWLRVVSIGLVVVAVGLVGWAVPDPAGPTPWLERNGWLFVALAAGAVASVELLPRRLAPAWAHAARTAGGIAWAAAVAVVLVHLGQQVLAFDPVSRRTPLSVTAVGGSLLALAVLTVLALRVALRPDRDPLALPDSRRGGYVYLAELLVVAVFVVVRLNVPEVFIGAMARYWTFIVMLLAFAVAGTAELFDHRRLAVLSTPLRRTGVLLPLVPLLAFWARPPGVVLEFADANAPGLRPMLGYLEKLPQHFDLYAGLWLLAGLLYGLLAAARKSFGWALVAALAANAGVWALLTHHEVPAAVHPQAWVIPLALIVLVAEHVHRTRLRPDLSAGLRYLGVAMIYVASASDMFIAGVGKSLWLPVVLAALCLAGVLLGILLRVREFLFLGIGFLLLDVFAMVWHAAVDRNQTWVWYASGIVLGVAILALFAALEKRRNDVRELVARVKQWD